MEKIENKKKKRFNFVDVILLVVILAIIGGVVYAYLSPVTKQLFAKTYKVTYTLKVQNVRLEFNNKIKADDKVVETETLKEIGTVTNVVYTASKFVGTDASGKTVTNNYPDMYDATITVKADAEMPSGMYTVNTYSIMAGKTIPFRVPGFTGEALCLSISEDEVSEGGGE